MKFKAGDRVEVFRRNEEPYGSWFPAKTLSVDGYKYTIRYEQFLTAAGNPVVEKVHEEDIRPHPPPVCGEERWTLSNIVEVFDLHSWKVGKIVKVLQNNYYVVRIFGSIQLKEFHISSLRVRQAWHNNRWVMIGKVIGKKQFDSGCTHSSSKYTAHNSKYATYLGCRVDDAIVEEGCTGERVKQDHDATFSPARTLKKNTNFQYSLLTDDKKRKAITKVGGSHQQAKRALPRKVDVVSVSKIMVGEDCMHTSSKDRIIRSVEMDVDNGNIKHHAMHSLSVPLQIIEEDNECSVASCSGNNLPEYTSWNTRNNSREIANSSFDNTTSSSPFQTVEEYLSIPEDKLAADIHKLELHAYQSTMQALYASGPLSWEQESLLTNLRLSLHISNEEHLLQLRNLLSA